MINILILYHNGEYPLRATIFDHLYSFREYSNCNCCYLNTAVRKIPRYINIIKFDLIIFHTNFLSQRWHLEKFTRLMDKVSVLKDYPALKIALPQDEFIHTDILCHFINEFNITHIFSVAPESEWRKIYESVSFKEVQFHNVLTGYLDDATVGRINALAKHYRNRQIDVGYRAWHAAPWLGKHGLLKTRIADLFQKYSIEKNFKADISTRAEDTLLGDAWYKFLLQCKYTIGVEGGASVLDTSGSIKQSTERYMREKPDATFEEIAAKCFPEQDGKLQLFALSPRHLEACATRTCQILVEGEYNGILIANQHYIALKRDFGNLDEVFDKMIDCQLREQIVNNAYRDIVLSGKYNYDHFVQFVIDKSTVKEKNIKNMDDSIMRKVYVKWMKIADKLSIGIVAICAYTILKWKKHLNNYLMSKK